MRYLLEEQQYAPIAMTFFLAVLALGLLLLGGVGFGSRVCREQLGLPVLCAEVVVVGWWCA